MVDGDEDESSSLSLINSFIYVVNSLLFVEAAVARFYLRYLNLFNF